MLMLQFICSPTDFHAGKPVLVAAIPPSLNGQSDACQFYFEWRSHVACPTNKKSELETGHYIAFGSMQVSLYSPHTRLMLTFQPIHCRPHLVLGPHTV